MLIFDCNGVLVDSEVLSQAVYLYRPILADDGSVADLEVALMNRAAHRVPLSSHIVEGLRTSTVFVDNQKATDAATIAWQGGVAPKYEIERRGFVQFGFRREQTHRYRAFLLCAFRRSAVDVLLLRVPHGAEM